MHEYTESWELKDNTETILQFVHLCGLHVFVHECGGWAPSKGATKVLPQGNPQLTNSLTADPRSGV